MTPAEIHKRIADVFDEALQLAPQERTAFLDAQCAGNPELRQRVERMLQAEERAPESFLGKPALQAAAELLANGAAATTQNITGQTLGNYRIGKQIGAGGMGTVYEGLDLRLNRKVAIKILPPMFVADPERIRRFEQEARAASLLNHPNIVSIFDAGQDTGTGFHYIAIELVEGETLRDILRRDGSLAAKDLTEIGIQICSALGAAHKAGILHRDIKPENIMVRPDGIIKVLDFGLAKLMEGGAPGTDITQTRAGHIAGTVHYLSPEQVLGKTVDARSDLFSVGVVLYELATGSRPFEGPTDGAVFQSILHKIPDMPSGIRPNLPRSLEQVILHTVEKDPDLRYQSASDLRAALKRLDRDSRSGFPLAPSGTAVTHAKSPWRPVAMAVAATALLLLGPALWWKTRTDHDLALLKQPVAFDRLTSEANEEVYPTLSPDGTQMTFASAKSGNWDIYLQRVGGQTPINLTKDSPEDDTEPAISPDGKRIAFYSKRNGGGVFVMEATGENPRKIWQKGRTPAWSPDGKRLVVADESIENPSRVGPLVSSLHIVDVESGSVRTLPEPRLAFQPKWSPNGRRIAYWTRPGATGQRDVYTVAADGASAPVPATSDPQLDWNPEWAPDGRHLYFLSDRGGTMNIWRMAFDQTSGRALSEPSPVTSPSRYVKHFRIAGNGQSFVFVAAEGHVDLFAAGLSADARSLTARPSVVGDGTTSVNGFMISPDETKIVFDNLGDAQEDLWIMNIDGSGRRRLTNDRFRDLDPTWSPDGKVIAFYSDRDGKKYNIWTVFADGSGMRQVTHAPDGEVPMAPVYTHDGQSLMYFTWEGNPRVIRKGESKAEYLRGYPKPGLNGTYLQPSNPPRDPRESRYWIGRERLRDGSFELEQYDLETGEVKLLGLPGTSPAWLPGQKRVVCLNGTDVVSYDLVQKAQTKLFSTYPNKPSVLRVNRDGTRVYFTVAIREGDIWLGRFPQP